MLIPISKRLTRLKYLNLVSLAFAIVLTYTNRKQIFNCAGVFYLRKASQNQPFNVNAPDYLNKAESLFYKALEMDSTFAISYANLGVLSGFRASEKAYSQGKEYFKKAFELCPDKVEILLLAFDYSTIYRPIDFGVDLEFADTLITRALMLEPKNPEVFSHLAMYQSELLSQHDEALLNLEKSAKFQSKINLFPKLSSLYLAHHNLNLSEQLSALAGLVYFRRLKYDGKSIPPPEELDWIPKMDNFYLGIAKEFIKDGDYSKGIQYLTLSLEINPSNRWALTESARAYYLMGEYRNAINMYKSAIKVSEEKEFLYSDLAFAYKENKEYEHSINAFKAAIKKGFPEKMGFYNIAAVSALKGDKGLMIDYLNKAIALDASYRFYSKSDSSFKHYWDDTDFIRTTLN